MLIGCGMSFSPFSELSTHHAAKGYMVNFLQWNLRWRAAPPAICGRSCCSRPSWTTCGRSSRVFASQILRTVSLKRLRTSLLRSTCPWLLPKRGGSDGVALLDDDRPFLASLVQQPLPPTGLIDAHKSVLGETRVICEVAERVKLRTVQRIIQVNSHCFSPLLY